MKRTFLFTLLIGFLSCNSEDNQQTETTINEEEITKVSQEKLENSFALSLGNIWVYKNYKLNESTGNYEETSVVDSISIVAKEIIDEKEYFKFRRMTTGNDPKITLCNPNGEHFYFRRQEEGDLVDEKGTIISSFENNQERLINTLDIFSIYEVLEKEKVAISIESGDFESYVTQRYAKRNDNEERYPAIDRFYFVEGIGLVKDTSSFLNKEIPTIERRLTSYELK